MKYKKTIITITIIIVFTVGIYLGAFFLVLTQSKLMDGYDLYACVYNNAQRNSYNKHPVMIQKIQNECICFSKNNYTNLLEANC